MKDRFRLNYARFFLAVSVWLVAFLFGIYAGRYLKWFSDFLLAVPIGILVYLLSSRPFKNLRRERVRCLNCGRMFSVKIPVNNFITGFAKGDVEPKPYPNERTLLVTHSRCGRSMYVFYRETPPLELLSKEGR